MGMNDLLCTPLQFARFCSNNNVVQVYCNVATYEYNVQRCDTI